MKPKVEPGDAPVGVCAECGVECEGILVDFGYGYYEFGSDVGTDENWRWVSPCCEDEVIDYDPEEKDDD